MRKRMTQAAGVVRPECRLERRLRADPERPELLRGILPIGKRWSPELRDEFRGGVVSQAQSRGGGWGGVGTAGGAGHR